MFENIPHDMKNDELEDLSAQFVGCQMFKADAWNDDSGVRLGSFEVDDPEDARAIASSLNGRKMKDVEGRLRVWCEPPGRHEEFKKFLPDVLSRPERKPKGKGKGYDGGKPDDRNGRRDYRDDRDGRRDDDREGGGLLYDSMA
jgi:hypothetical protein